MPIKKIIVVCMNADFAFGKDFTHGSCRKDADIFPFAAVVFIRTVSGSWYRGVGGSQQLHEASGGMKAQTSRAVRLMTLLIGPC